MDVGAREFRRLSREEARRLAEAKGLALPETEDASLAEIYCGSAETPSLARTRKIGFA